MKGQSINLPEQQGLSSTQGQPSHRRMALMFSKDEKGSLKKNLEEVCVDAAQIMAGIDCSRG